MTISSMHDLRNYVNGWGFDTISDWAAIADEVAHKLTSYDDCPEFGQDWSEFLAGFDIEALVIEADDALMGGCKMDETTKFMIDVIESQPALPGVVVAEMAIQEFRIAPNSDEGVYIYDVACKMKNMGIPAYLRLLED
jgi:hypothetical protein